MGSSLDRSVIDLSRESREYYRDRRTGRISLLIFAVALITMLLVLSLEVSLQLRGGRALTSVQVDLFLSFIVGFGLSVAVLLFSWYRMAQGAVSMALDSTGLGLQGPGDRVVRLKWTDPRLSFSLRDWSNVPSVVRTGLPYYLEIPWARTHALSRDAFEAILSEARRQGLDIRSSGGAVGLYSSAVLYRIRHPLDSHQVP